MRRGSLRLVVLAAAIAVVATSGSVFADMVSDQVDIQNDVLRGFKRAVHPATERPPWESEPTAVFHRLVNPPGEAWVRGSMAPPVRVELTICASKKIQTPILKSQIGLCNAAANSLSFAVQNGDQSQVLTLSGAELKVVKVDGAGDLVGLIESGDEVHSFKLASKQHYTIDRSERRLGDRQMNPWGADLQTGGTYDA